MKPKTALPWKLIIQGKTYACLRSSEERFGQPLRVFNASGSKRNIADLQYAEMACNVHQELIAVIKEFCDAFEKAKGNPVSPWGLIAGRAKALLAKCGEWS